MAATVSLKFIKNYRKWNAGDTAGFEGNAAAVLVGEGLATIASGTLPAQTAPLVSSGRLTHDGSHNIS